MTNQVETFLRGLQRVIDSRQDLTVSSLATKATLSNSTLRKLLSGENKSPRLATCQKLADAAELSFDAIVAIGKSENYITILQAVEIIDDLPEGELELALDYLRFLKAKNSAS